MFFDRIDWTFDTGRTGNGQRMEPVKPPTVYRRVQRLTGAGLLSLLLVASLPPTRAEPAQSSDADNPGAPAQSTKPALPKIELGAGVVGQLLADYRGSEHYQFNALPFPYVVYRGKFLELDRSGARGKLFRSRDMELVISADAALTPDSSDNPLREGMPELHSTFELGPSLNFRLGGTLEDGWSLHLPFRAVFDYDRLQADYVGWLFNPQLAFINPAFKGEYKLQMRFGALYADNDYHEYYYGVDPEYATENRRRYDAKSGYSGSHFKIGISRRLGKWWLGSYLRYDTLYGTSNRNSPLMQTDHYFSFGLGVSRLLWQSAATSAHSSAASSGEPTAIPTGTSSEASTGKMAGEAAADGDGRGAETPGH